MCGKIGFKKTSKYLYKSKKIVFIIVQIYTKIDHKNLNKIKTNFLKNVKNSFKNKSKFHFTLEYLLFN